MRTLLICHHDEPVNRDAIAGWLASFTTLAGIVEIREPRERKWRRVRREVTRVGPLRFLDVLAFRLHHRLWLHARELAWARETLAALRVRYPLPASVPVLRTGSPNSPEAERFIRDAAPDLVLARCKSLLAERVFTIPRLGTFVMHPGVCPEYRNAHGCFWALVRGDTGRVGMTLLRVDRGVDTGPVFGWYSYPFDERAETPFIIQERVVLENLGALARRFEEIAAGTAAPLDTTGRASAAWGQPWLSSYLRWRRGLRLQG